MGRRQTLEDPQAGGGSTGQDGTQKQKEWLWTSERQSRRAVAEVQTKEADKIADKEADKDADKIADKEVDKKADREGEIAAACLPAAASELTELDRPVHAQENVVAFNVTVDHRA